MIIFSLDGVLANYDHRKHFIDEASRSFNESHHAFYDSCDQDAVIEKIKRIFLLLTNNEDPEDFQIWSSRSDEVRIKTIRWIQREVLNDSQTPFYVNAHLKLRPIGNVMTDCQIKEKWLNESIESGVKIDYVFESDFDSIKMWLRRGVFVFRCGQIP